MGGSAHSLGVGRAAGAGGGRGADLRRIGVVPAPLPVPISTLEPVHPNLLMKPTPAFGELVRVLKAPLHTLLCPTAMQLVGRGDCLPFTGEKVGSTWPPAEPTLGPGPGVPSSRATPTSYAAFCPSSPSFPQ